MPPKGRKSLVYWQSCDNCGSILNAKDVEVHAKFCPVDFKEWKQSFIYEKELFSFAEDLEEKGLPSLLNVDILDDIILLSQSAMQICGFAIGFPVLVQIGEDSVFKKAWPTIDGVLTTARLSFQSLEFGWKRMKSKLIKVSCCPKTVLAKEIYFEVDSEISSKNTEILCKLIQAKARRNSYFAGYHLKISFYGKPLDIKFVKFVPFESNLDDLIDSLSLTENPFTPLNTSEFKLIEKNKKDEKVEKLKFGGYSSIIEEIKRNISSILSSKSFCGCCGILIYGVHGVGKTLLSKYIAQESNLPTFEIQGMELFSKYYGETEKRIRDFFSVAISQNPCIVVVDNIEILCPKKGTDQEKRVASTFISQFDAIRDSRVIILATSSTPDDIETSLRRPGRLEYEIELPVPSADDRFQILNSIVDDVKVKGTLNEISVSSHGFVAADLASVVTKAVCAAALEKRDFITDEDLRRSFHRVKPSAMREIAIEIPNVLWDDIGGQDDLKMKLQQSVEWPLKYPESFQRLGIKPPRGVLMYGPPGCSKTLIAKALATESKLNFLSVKGSDIFSKWVGESERAMRDLFKKARSVAPSIIFLDEIDALGSERETSSSGGSAVQERVLSQLLTEMDGVRPLENVIIIAATNRPDRIDRALLRPGRLDRLIYVPLPDANTRREILKLKFKKMPVHDSVNIESLVYKTDNYSGAEVVALCEEAAMFALEENIEADIIANRHFEKALNVVTPRTPDSLLKIYENYSLK